MTDPLEIRAAMLDLYRAKPEIYFSDCLKILDKEGKTQHFVLNRAQRFAHELLEEQLKETGKVRAIAVKGRQQGFSTYVSARFYRRTSLWRGMRAFIVSHEQKSTDGLFGIVKRYQDNNPIAPTTLASNAKELLFGRLDGGYKVATAGTQDTGRSNTAQLLHGSEFAFWKDAQKHLAGIGNTIGDMPGSEIILESTGNGMGNAFHTMWQGAEAGTNEYLPIFVPWYWQDEYRAKLHRKFDMSSADEEYQRAYGLDMEQMAWRANKISTYGPGFEWLFRQEYPAIPLDAFQAPTANPLISPTAVAAAMNSEFSEKYGAFVIGCDPAEFGDDRTAIIFRHGRVVYRIEVYEKKGPMEVAGRLAAYWKEFQPDGLLVDRIGIGSGIVDRLKELNIPVIGVNSAQSAEDDETYANLRAEMWYRMKAWIDDTPCRLPKDMALASDLSAPGYKSSSNGLKLIESKDSMRKRGLRSTDLADALALTFAVNVAAKSNQVRRAPEYRPATRAGY